MRSRVEIITPEKAKEYLQKNSLLNRRIRPHVVDAYATDMKNGQWRCTHEGIAFSKSGLLIDGQHRLMAIIKSGCSIPMLVTFGLDDNSMAVIDQGLTRSTPDALTIQNGGQRYRYANSLIGTLRFITEFKFHSAEKLTTSQVQRFISTHSDYVNAIQWLNSIHVIPSAVATALVCAMIRGEKKEAVEAFLNTLYHNKVSDTYNNRGALDLKDYLYLRNTEGRGARKILCHRTETALFEYVHRSGRVKDRFAERYEITREDLENFRFAKEEK